MNAAGKLLTKRYRSVKFSVQDERTSHNDVSKVGDRSVVSEADTGEEQERG